MSAIERYLLMAVFFLISVFAAYQYGRISAASEIEIDSLKLENKNINKAVEKKDELAEDLNKLESSKDEKIKQMSSDYALLHDKYKRLRVGKNCGNVAESPAAAVVSDGGRQAGEVGEGTGGIYIGDVAEEVIRLGSDLDEADIQIANLKNIAQKLHQNCTIGAN